MVNRQVDRSPERARQDYCKAIFQVGGGRPVRAADVARALAVSRASVTQIVRDLKRDGYLGPQAGHRLSLTEKGRRLALVMLRRHRLVETFLHAMLHVPLERLHAEAERIEHAVSNDVARRLEKLLRYPAVDPHGDPIPVAGGCVPRARRR